MFINTLFFSFSFILFKLTLGIRCFSNTKGISSIINNVQRDLEAKINGKGPKVKTLSLYQLEYPNSTRVEYDHLDMKIRF